MNLIDIILLGFALGIDCFIASFSQGLIFMSHRRKNSVMLALTMGLFQGLMPVIGYITADKIYNILVPYSKIIVFSIFFILGIHFILESFNQLRDEKNICISIKCLLSLGIATSIDALFAGGSLRLVFANLLISCLVIGILSFFMSISGFVIGNYIKRIPEKYMQICGGLILIALGVKTLF